jgi:hypothetical protein
MQCIPTKEEYIYLFVIIYILFYACLSEDNESSTSSFLGIKFNFGHSVELATHGSLMKLLTYDFKKNSPLGDSYSLTVLLVFK